MSFKVKQFHFMNCSEVCTLYSGLLNSRPVMCYNVLIFTVNLDAVDLSSYHKVTVYLKPSFALHLK